MTVYNGNGSLVTATSPGGAPNRIAITSSTNASPIVVTTSAPHGFNTGDSVEVSGHLANTAANGFWQIAVASSTTFALNGSTGNGVGASTGYAIDYELQPALTLPANGRLADADDVNLVAEGLANTAPFLYRASGAYRLYNVTYAQGAANDPGFTGGAYATMTAISASTLTTFTGAGNVIADTTAYVSGDIACVDLAMNFQAFNANAGVAIPAASLVLGWCTPGGSLTGLPFSAVAACDTVPASSSLLSTRSMHVQASYFPSLAHPSGLQFGVMIYTLGTLTTDQQYYLLGPWMATVYHYRPN